MRGMPSTTQVAEIVWAECSGIRASSTQVTSAATYAHRLAIALCVVNRGRQGLPWGDGVQTCEPRGGPSAADRGQSAVQAAWSETQRATAAAMQTVSQPLNSEATLRGAQLYCHTWTAPFTGIRLEGSSWRRMPPGTRGPPFECASAEKLSNTLALARSGSACTSSKGRETGRSLESAATPSSAPRHVPFGPQE